MMNSSTPSLGTEKATVQATCVFASMGADYQWQWEHLIKWDREKLWCTTVCGDHCCISFQLQSSAVTRSYMLFPGQTGSPSM